MPYCMPRRAGASVALSLFALLTGAAAPAGAAIVQTFDIGDGGSASTIQVDFSNGNGYLFTVHFDGALTGLGALQLMAQEIGVFTLETESYPWGDLVAGIGVAGDYDYGTGDLWPIENYWHYWVQDDSHDWVWSSQGASDRLLFDGSADAWVFGSGAAPQIVPGAPAVVVFALAAPVMGGRGRRRAGARR